MRTVVTRTRVTARETYPQARVRLLAELRAAGWTTRPDLKRPWAEKDGHRFWFTAQAIYYHEHSTFLDMRGLRVDVLMRFAQDALTASDAVYRSQR